MIQANLPQITPIRGWLHYLVGILGLGLSLLVFSMLRQMLFFAIVGYDSVTKLRSLEEKNKPPANHH